MYLILGLQVFKKINSFSGIHTCYPRWYLDDGVGQHVAFIVNYITCIYNVWFYTSPREFVDCQGPIPATLDDI